MAAKKEPGRTKHLSIGRTNRASQTAAQQPTNALLALTFFFPFDSPLHVKTCFILFLLL